MTLRQPHLSHPKYRPDIDGLRAIAVLAVVAFHAFPDRVRGGFIGVDVFFVISGYLISTIIFENLDKGAFSFAEFYTRRIKRIFPALLVILITCFTFGWFALLADEYKQLGKHMAAGAGFISNFILWNEAGYFDNSAETKPLLHLWSLGIEEQFYIVWPLFLWFAWKRKFNLFLITMVVAIGSFALNLKGVKSDVVTTFYSPLSRFWELLCGSLLAWLALYRKDAFSSIKHKVVMWISRIIYRGGQESNGRGLKNLLSFVGLIFLLYGFGRINKTLSFPGYWALVPVLGAVLIIMAGPKAWVNRTILSHKVAVWFGLISFPLYLWHWPILSFARIVESEEPSLGMRIGAIALSIALAWLTYKFVERPMRFGAHGKVKVAVLIALMAIVGFVGYNTYSRDGYELRGSIKGFVNYKNELIRTPAVDGDCLKYVGTNNLLFPYCRYTNANAEETVAIIGDSHAHAAYPGISEFLLSKGVNSVLLANSSCPPFIGSYTGRHTSEKDACRDRIDQLLNIVSSHKDIKKVFIFTRGPIYNGGASPLAGDKNASDSNVIPINDFAGSAQLSINALSKAGKIIYYVTENPEISYPIESCLNRPFRSGVKNCSAEKSTVLNRQADYLNAFNKLKNVTIINSLTAFCPQKDCIVFDENGYLLYADDNHLSIAGSKFQVTKLLEKFLD